MEFINFIWSSSFIHKIAENVYIFQSILIICQNPFRYSVSKCHFSLGFVSNEVISRRNASYIDLSCAIRSNISGVIDIPWTCSRSYISLEISEISGDDHHSDGFSYTSIKKWYLVFIAYHFLSFYAKFCGLSRIFLIRGIHSGGFHIHKTYSSIFLSFWDNCSFNARRDS